MKKILFISITLFLIYNLNYSLATNYEYKKYTIEGTVAEKSTATKIEYATIALYEKSDNSLITGTITDSDGYFIMEINESGNFYLKISFIGFEELIIDDIILNSENQNKNLNIIYLLPNSTELDEVTVEAERIALDYKIDKKIVNVSEINSIGLSDATEILENVAGINVDLDGNVSLRGNSNFTVLINGKPSALEGSEALQQIPASMISQIELITNASAKYNPEGTAGIINVITKKNKLLGISGVVNASAGTFDNYGGDILLNYNKEKFGIYFKADYGKRGRMREVEDYSQSLINDTTYYFNSEGESNFSREKYGFTFGFELTPDSFNTFNAEISLAERGFIRYSDLIYKDWNSVENFENIYNSESSFGVTGNFNSVSMSYTRLFRKKDEKLIFMVTGFERNPLKESIIEKSDNYDNIIQSEKTLEDGPVKGMEYRLDYELPINEKNKIEAGFDGRFYTGFQENERYFLNQETENFEKQDVFSNKVNFFDSYQGVYALYLGSLQKLEYQLGARGEYTYRNIFSETIDDETNIKQLDFFPTLHLSYKLNKNQQLMASYTRRISRPRPWHLWPYPRWFDTYNIRMGNPDLLPEFVDAMELSYQKELGKNLFSFEVYYKTTKDKIEEIYLPYEENIRLEIHENVGKDNSVGSIINFSLVPAKWYMLDLSGDFYKYNASGNFDGKNYSKNNFNWGAGFSNTIKLGKNTKIQINGNYSSPSVWAQGTNNEYYFVGAAIKQTFFDKNLSLTLQCRDVLGLSDRETIYESENYYSRSFSHSKYPYINFSISWKFNNYEAINRPEIDIETE